MLHQSKPNGDFSPVKPLQKAVCLIFRCKGELFIITRNDKMRHFPGHTSFPGGKAEINESLWEAAVREASEELKVDLKSANFKNYEKLGTLTTPLYFAYRFETHYFLFDCETRPSFDWCRREFKRAIWKSPKEILDDYHLGDRMLVPLVRHLLEQFANQGDLKKPVLESQTSVADVPVFEIISDLPIALVRSHTLPPWDRTNCLILERTAIDPSPREKSDVDFLIELFRTKKIDQILISHHHQDHHEYACDIARAIKASVLISQQAKDLIEKNNGLQYFSGLDITIISEGQKIDQWKSSPVLALETPGHAWGQISLMPKNRKWLFAGDLFQEGGSVVIGTENGSMKEYMKSLQRLIKLEPAVCIPSHGHPVGGIYPLERNLRHRISREKQVKELWLKDFTTEKMLELLYPQLQENLKPYAMANIESHLQKLRNENSMKN